MQEATKELSKRSVEIYKKLRPLEPKRETTGWVWLHQQKAAPRSF